MTMNNENETLKFLDNFGQYMRQPIGNVYQSNRSETC